MTITILAFALVIVPGGGLTSAGAQVDSVMPLRLPPEA